MSFRSAGSFERHRLSRSSIALTTSDASTQSLNTGLTMRPVRSIGSSH